MDLKEYQRYRRAYVDLNRRLMKACLTPALVGEAAAVLGLTVSHQNGEPVLEVEDQHEFELATDFMLHEWRPEGKSLLEPQARSGANKVERDLLKAVLGAPASLYEVLERDSAAGELRLRDLLQPDKPAITLTDLAVSQWAQPGVKLYLRPMRLPVGWISASPPMVFSAQTEPPAISAGDEPAPAAHDDARRFRAYFGLYRQVGLRGNVKQPV